MFLMLSISCGSHGKESQHNGKKHDEQRNVDKNLAIPHRRCLHFSFWNSLIPRSYGCKEAQQKAMIKP